MSSFLRGIENFDLISLLEVIEFYLRLELDGAFYDLFRELPGTIPPSENLIKWAGLLLDAGLLKIMGNREKYEEILSRVKTTVELSIKRREAENALKSRIHTLGINKGVSVPSVTHADVVLENIYL